MSVAPLIVIGLHRKKDGLLAQAIREYCRATNVQCFEEEEFSKVEVGAGQSVLKVMFVNPTTNLHWKSSADGFLSERHHHILIFWDNSKTEEVESYVGAASESHGIVDFLRRTKNIKSSECLDRLRLILAGLKVQNRKPDLEQGNLLTGELDIEQADSSAEATTDILVVIEILLIVFGGLVLALIWVADNQNPIFEPLAGLCAAVVAVIHIIRDKAGWFSELRPKQQRMSLLCLIVVTSAITVLTHFLTRKAYEKTPEYPPTEEISKLAAGDGETARNIIKGPPQDGKYLVSYLVRDMADDSVSDAEKSHACLAFKQLADHVVLVRHADSRREQEDLARALDMYSGLEPLGRIVATDPVASEDTRRLSIETLSSMARINSTRLFDRCLPHLVAALGDRNEEVYFGSVRTIISLGLAAKHPYVESALLQHASEDLPKGGGQRYQAIANCGWAFRFYCQHASEDAPPELRPTLRRMIEEDPLEHGEASALAAIAMPIIYGGSLSDHEIRIAFDVLRVLESGDKDFPFEGAGVKPDGDIHLALRSIPSGRVPK